MLIYQTDLHFRGIQTREIDITSEKGPRLRATATVHAKVAATLYDPNVVMEIRIAMVGAQ